MAPEAPGRALEVEVPRPAEAPAEPPGDAPADEAEPVPPGDAPRDEALPVPFQRCQCCRVRGRKVSGCSCRGGKSHQCQKTWEGEGEPPDIRIEGQRRRAPRQPAPGPVPPEKVISITIDVVASTTFQLRAGFAMIVAIYYS